MMYKKYFAIITPYYKEDPEVIRKAINSVKQLIQTELTIKHYLVADGFPIDLQSDEVIHVALPTNHSDYGDTPRMIGAALAIRDGCYGLMFLDADNLLYPSHLFDAFNAHKETGCEIVVARRDVLSTAGVKLTYPEEDKKLEHVDTGCFVFFKEAVYDALDWIKIPNEYSAIGDRYYWKMLISKRKQVGVLEKPTIGYTSLWKFDYSMSNIQPPENAKDLDLSEYNEFNDKLSPEDKLVIHKRLFG